MYIKHIILTLNIDVNWAVVVVIEYTRGRSRGGVAHPVRAPPKIGKNMIFWHKIVIFHTKYPQHFHPSLRNWKKNDFLG